MTRTNEQGAGFDRLDNRFFGGNLKEKLKKQSFRRNVVKLGCIMPLMFGFILSWVVWSFMAPNPETQFEKLLYAVFLVDLVILILISGLLDMTVNSVSPQKGEIYDERQNMEYLQARSDALGINGFLFLIMVIDGFAILLMNVNGTLSFTHPHYSGIHYYIGLAAAALVGAKLSAGMLLAWRLPDMDDDEDDVYDQ